MHICTLMLAIFHDKSTFEVHFLVVVVCNILTTRWRCLFRFGTYPFRIIHESALKLYKQIVVFIIFITYFDIYSCI